MMWLPFFYFYTRFEYFMGVKEPRFVSQYLCLTKINTRKVHSHGIIAPVFSVKQLFRSCFY